MEEKKRKGEKRMCNCWKKSTQANIIGCSTIIDVQCQKKKKRNSWLGSLPRMVWLEPRGFVWQWPGLGKVGDRTVYGRLNMQAAGGKSSQGAGVLKKEAKLNSLNPTH
jgi:hypothetical protein